MKHVGISENIIKGGCAKSKELIDKQLKNCDKRKIKKTRNQLSILRRFRAFWMIEKKVKDTLVLRRK